MYVHISCVHVRLSVHVEVRGQCNLPTYPSPEWWWWTHGPAFWGGGLGIQTRVLTLAQQALQQFSSPPAPALPAPTAHRFCSGTCLFLSLHQVGLQTHATMPGFYVGAGDLNRGLNDCAARSKLAD